ncbi:MAG: hypothetical protein LBR86_03605 [Tannerella sp.]|nr:hypothetical protein [Tannerella sp.]
MLARELVPVLEYVEWCNFSNVLDRAILACRNSGFEIVDHFVEVNKTVKMPSKARPRQIVDYKLSRYTCYLIVQNGGLRKEIIATGQTYFAIQTRRQEVVDYFNRLDEDNKRLVIRGDIRQWNQMLAEEKIRKEQRARNAVATHNQVGQEVRKTIERVGGILPENQPTPAKSIEEVQKEQLKKLKTQKTFMLDEQSVKQPIERRLGNPEFSCNFASSNQKMTNGTF